MWMTVKQTKHSNVATPQKYRRKMILKSRKVRLFCQIPDGMETSWNEKLTSVFWRVCIILVDYNTILNKIVILTIQNGWPVFSVSYFCQCFDNCLVYCAKNPADNQPRQQQKHHWAQSTGHTTRIDFVSVFIVSITYLVLTMIPLCK